jgi:hypothetical protein
VPGRDLRAAAAEFQVGEEPGAVADHLRRRGQWTRIGSQPAVTSQPSRSDPIAFGAKTLETERMRPVRLDDPVADVLCTPLATRLAQASAAVEPPNPAPGYNCRHVNMLQVQS